MIFFWLFLIALTFGLLGFLLHAFYFGKQHLVQNLRREVEDMKKALASGEAESQKAWEEIAKTKILIHSLKHQLQQSNETSCVFQSTAMRQGQGIHRTGEKGADTTAVPAWERRESATQLVSEQNECKPGVLADIPDDDLNSGPGLQTPAEGGKTTEIPLWKRNLHNILSTLDKLEKEEKE